ncbi:hypothetical protein HYX07_02050 [Candidatus Woesearchaeota archaeon]|nr:hypothetical protein [Candidatus Woesearchaeota archaeon]
MKKTIFSLIAIFAIGLVIAGCAKGVREAAAESPDEEADGIVVNDMENDTSGATDTNIAGDTTTGGTTSGDTAADTTTSGDTTTETSTQDTTGTGTTY